MNVQPFISTNNSTLSGFENQTLPSVNGEPFDSVIFNGTLVPQANGDGVPLKYFFIFAVPLAIVTVMVPLLILPFITFVVRRTVFPRATWKRLHIGFWVFTFVLNLVHDILALIITNIFFQVFGSIHNQTHQRIHSYLHKAYAARNFNIFLLTFMTLAFFIQFSVVLAWLARRGKSWEQKHKTIRARGWWIVLWCYLVISYYLSSSLVSQQPLSFPPIQFINLVPYLLGFGVLLSQYWRRRRRPSAIEE